MYLVFAWDQYYPTGGSSQIAGKANSEEEALEIAKTSGSDYWEIYCPYSGTIKRGSKRDFEADTVDDDDPY
jgi:hypothetical protein